MAPWARSAATANACGGVVEVETVRDQRGRDLGPGGEDRDRGLELAAAVRSP